MDTPIKYTIKGMLNREELNSAGVFDRARSMYKSMYSVDRVDCLLVKARGTKVPVLIENTDRHFFTISSYQDGICSTDLLNLNKYIVSKIVEFEFYNVATFIVKSLKPVGFSDDLLFDLVRRTRDYMSDRELTSYLTLWQTLLMKGIVDLDLRDEYGNTLLMHSYNAQLSNLFLLSGIKAYAINDEGNNALDVLLENRFSLDNVDLVIKEVIKWANASDITAHSLDNYANSPQCSFEVWQLILDKITNHYNRG